METGLAFLIPVLRLKGTVPTIVRKVLAFSIACPRASLLKNTYTSRPDRIYFRIVFASFASRASGYFDAKSPCGP